MKSGIVLIFCNQEAQLESDWIRLFLGYSTKTKLVLLNNGSSDKTLDRLRMQTADYKDELPLIDIKKNKGIRAAVKSGARYLRHLHELRYIGYLSMEKPESLDFLRDFIRLCEYYCANDQVHLIESQIQKMSQNEVFSVSDLVRNMSEEITVVKLA